LICFNTGGTNTPQFSANKKGVQEIKSHLG
jgi:hypothetical protein